MNAVIFDLDGVLVSTDELHFKAWQRLASELGIVNFTNEDNLRQRGVSRMESLEIVLAKSDKSYSDEEKLELATRKNGYYIELLGELTEESILPGALDTLKLLKVRGILAAVGSASKNAGLILDKTGLKQYLDVIADGHDVTHSKPDPQVFEVAAQKLGADPHDCLVVEDADAGIIAGHAAKMKTLGVGPAASNSYADFTAANLADKMLDWDKILA